MYIIDPIAFLNSDRNSVVITGETNDGISITAVYAYALPVVKARHLLNRVVAAIEDLHGHNFIKINRSLWDITKNFVVNTDDEEWLMDLIQGKATA